MAIAFLYIIFNLILIDMLTRTFYHQKKYEKLLYYHKLFKRIYDEGSKKNKLNFIIRKHILSFLFSSASLLSIGSSLISLGKNKEFLELSEYTTSKYNKDPFFFVDRSEALFFLEEYYEALKSLKIAKELDPLNTDVFFLQGIILLRLNKLREAYSSFDELIRVSKLLEQIDSKNPYIHHNIALGYS